MLTHSRSLVVFFLTIFLFLLFPCSKAHAAGITVTGKAVVLTTGNSYLDFTAYNSNVTIDATTGNFSGHAFLEDVGWVAFGTTDNIDGPVHVNLTTGVVSGKAKVLTTNAFLTFSDHNSNVLVNVGTGVFSGMVFSEDVGWIDFSNIGVTLSSPLVTPTPISSSQASSGGGNDTPSSCHAASPGNQAPNLYAAIPEGNGSVTLFFTDAEAPYDHYAVEYGTKTNDYAWGNLNIGSKGTRTSPVGSLLPATTYYFRVRAVNDCANGNWSNEISSRTKPLVAFKQLTITEPTMTSSGETETDGKKLVPAEKTPTEVKNDAYSLQIKIIDTDGKPVKGVEVTIHSDVKKGITDDKGVVHFTDLEKGEHTVKVSYSGYTGEQSINVSGDVKTVALNMTVKPSLITFSPLAVGVVILLLCIIALLGGHIVRMRRRKNNVLSGNKSQILLVKKEDI